MQAIFRGLHVVWSFPSVAKRFYISQLLLLGWIICQLLIPFMIRDLIDKGINQQNQNAVTNAALWIVELSFSSAILAVVKPITNILSSLDIAIVGVVGGWPSRGS